MGKLSVIIPDELEEKLRKLALKRMSGRKGGLSIIVQEALELYIKNHEKEIKAI